MSHKDSRRRILDRRSFLKVGALGTALPLPSWLPGPATPDPPGPQTPQRELSTGLLPPIPTPADLASDRLVHHYRDYFNPPELQNELGFLQTVKSVSAVTAITFPPLSCCSSPSIPFSPGSLVTCELFLNGQILTAFPPPAGNVAYTWFPHKILRETRVQGLLFTTETFLPAKQNVVVESIEVKNESQQQRRVELGFDLRAGVTMTQGKPWFINIPAATGNRITTVESRGCVVFEDVHSPAVSVQGIYPKPVRIKERRMFIHELVLDPGEKHTLHYVNVIGSDKRAVLASYDHLQATFDGLLAENERHFASLLRSALTPHNSAFSGHLPQLHTNDAALWKHYYTGAGCLLFSRRVSPDSAYGPTYITVARIGTTLSFIWDTMLTSLSLALLDPNPLRSLVEAWLRNDMHQHLATDYLSGEAVGVPGYAVNDMGILRCADSYLRVTGDFAWLDKPVQGKPVIEHLVDHALYWKKLVNDQTGLADYGRYYNLLEVVSTYTHQVAAVNAGNVYGMRFIAALLERRGDATRAARLRSEARQLAERINRLLYVKGKGWWRCGQPNGTYNQIRHCFDLLTVLDTMFEDLSDDQKKEMSNFFWTQLHTPLWMHALSPYDVDATWNPRPDHSWLGAYIGWPSMTAKGLYKIDPPSRVSGWVKVLARAANQGLYGQAHMVESIFPPEQGGAFKSPFDQPYGNHWCEVAGGSFTDMVIDSIFGADLTLYRGINVNSRLEEFDAAAKLHGLHYQGKLYAISQKGSEPDNL